MIYTISDLQFTLDKIFRPLENDIKGMRLIKNNSSESNIDDLEKNLNCTLPKTFIDMISKYDFGNFSIGNIKFGYNENYLERLIKMNKALGFNQWWQGNNRPNHILLIATSDPYSILLNCQSGAIYAMLSDDEWLRWREVSVAIEAFVRSVGSIYLYTFDEYKSLDKPKLLTEIISLTKTKDLSFWEYMMI